MKLAFILKVLLFSAIISIAIKWFAPYVELEPSPILAISIVFTPTVILGMVLGRRFFKANS